MYAVIGDVHGCVRTLEALLDRVENKSAIDRYIFLGDVIDRGSNTKETVDLIIDVGKSKEVSVLKGNHEDMLDDYFRGRLRYNNAWLKYGGKETVKSFTGNRFFTKMILGQYFGAELESCMENYLPFFQEMELYETLVCEKERFFFSHAGILNGLAPNAMPPFLTIGDGKYIWNRNTHTRDFKHAGYTIVHGHTPVRSIDKHLPADFPFMKTNSRGEVCSVSMDTGCVYGDALSAMIIDYKGDFEFVSERARD